MNLYTILECRQPIVRVLSIPFLPHYARTKIWPFRAPYSPIFCPRFLPYSSKNDVTMVKC